MWNIDDHLCDLARIVSATSSGLDPELIDRSELDPVDLELAKRMIFIAKGKSLYQRLEKLSTER